MSSNSALYATVSTPAGPFTVITDAAGDKVLSSGWTDDLSTLTPQIHASLMPTDIVERVRIGAVTDAVTAYHEGEVTAIDSIAVQQKSGPFLDHAWEVLRAVPAGEPVTYTEYAALAGRPAAVRAAASACACNAAALFVPCHRVLRLDGSLGGFRWGLPVKQWLLTHEAA